MSHKTERRQLINPEEEKTTSAEEQTYNENVIRLDGSWERKNRNITAAAFFALIGIGAIYFNVQSILVTVLVAVLKAFYNIDVSGSFIQRMEAITKTMQTPILIAVVTTQFLFMLLPVLFVVKKWHTKDVKKYIRIKFYSAREVLLAVLITILFIPFCYLISSLLEKALHIPEFFQKMSSQLFAADSLPKFIFLVFAIAVTPAICEEIFFRGYFQRTLERTLGMKSFIITGIIFGLFHMQPLSLISLSLLGVLFSFFYYRSKSIFPSSFAHFTNNFIALSLLYFQSYFDNIKFPDAEWFPFLFVLLSLLAGSALIVVYIKITTERKDQPKFIKVDGENAVVNKNPNDYSI
jgi:uncharacterized protein